MPHLLLIDDEPVIQHAFRKAFHPPEYVDARVEVVDDRTVRLAFGPSDVFEEGDDHTWLAGLGGAGDRAIDALARVLDPHGSARPVATRGDERFAYELTVDEDAEPRLEEPETALARFSTAANFQFR